MYVQVTRDGSNSDLSKFSISRSKTAVPFFFSLYNKANLLPISRTPDLSKFSISRTKGWVRLHKFHCFSLSISRSLDC